MRSWHTGEYNSGFCFKSSGCSLPEGQLHFFDRLRTLLLPTNIDITAQIDPASASASAPASAPASARRKFLKISATLENIDQTKELLPLDLFSLEYIYE